MDAGQLAIRLRQGIWQLDEFVFQLPRADKLGTVTREECDHLADLLNTMSFLLRNFDPNADEDDADNTAGIIDITPDYGTASEDT